MDLHLRRWPGLLLLVSSQCMLGAPSQRHSDQPQRYEGVCEWQLLGVRTEY
jgi:hypothetical protein